MIKQNLRLNRLVKVLVLAGIMVSITLGVSAKNNKSEVSPSAIQSSVQYVSSDDEATTLLVQFNNKNKSSFTIIIRDEAGNTIYRNSFNEASFSKTFKVLNDANGIAQNLNVTISANGLKDQVYTVSNAVEIVNDVKVTKL